MKKDYMKPVGSLVAIRVNENIALSYETTPSAPFGLHYTIGSDGQRFILGSDFAASSTGDTGFDRFYDFIVTYVYGLSNCRFDPADSAE